MPAQQQAVTVDGNKSSDKPALPNTYPLPPTHLNHTVVDSSARVATQDNEITAQGCQTWVSQEFVDPVPSLALLMRTVRFELRFVLLGLNLGQWWRRVCLIRQIASCRDEKVRICEGICHHCR
eukprot:GHVQ01026241.1.p4 GENE.GHVQ01026241.1~~GHVQ01026241.1.p4  ORF type:complete len:123 (-),score=14.27 GHVQ01026241.1:657-1025(-)